LRAHPSFLLGVAFNRDGSRLATADRTGSVKIWDARRDHQVLVLGRHPALITDACFSPKGRWLAVVSGFESVASPEVFLYDAAGRLERRIVLDSPLSRWMPALAVAFTPDEKLLAIAAGSKVGETTLWDPTTGDCVHRFPPQKAAIKSLAVSPDGKLLAYAGDEGTIHVHGLPGHELKWSAPAHPGGVSALAFTPDSGQIASTGADRTLRFWDAGTGAPLHTMSGAQPFAGALVFRPDGEQFAAATSDNLIRLYETASRQEVGQLRGHSRSQIKLAFSPDGKRVISGASDRLVKVWDPQRQEELFTLRGHQDVISCIAFSPDGRRILAGSPDLNVLVWDAGPIK
jgi:WD40 repeat protein